MTPTFVPALSESLAAWLVRTSWQALVLVVIVAGLQWVFGKLLTPRWKYALWILVVVRLLMPVVPASRWSVFNAPMPRVPLAASRVAPGEGAKPQAADGVTVRIVKTFDGNVAPTPDDSGQVAAAPGAFDWRRTVISVWLAGATLLVLRFIIAHVLLIRRLRGAPDARDNVIALLDDCRREMRVRGDVRVIATNAVGGPALFGFLRPKLLVPPAMLRDLSRDDLRFVFLHELAHLKRRDTLLNIPLSLAAALHWFNPAVWFALSRCRTERELACDAMVLDVTDSPAGPQGYGQTMLRLAEALCGPRGSRRTMPAALGILETRSQLARRITMISAFRRSSSSRIGRVLPAMLLLGLASCALTDKPSGGGPATRPLAVAQVPAHGTPGEAEAAAPATQADAVDADTARTNQLLDRRIGELNLDEKPFSDAIDQLRQTSDLNLFVNWRALEAAGIARDTPVNLRLKHAKLSRVLQVVLDEVGGGTVKLGYEVEDGVVTITTAEDLNSNTHTRVYDVRDLITPFPDASPVPRRGGGAGEPAPTTQPQQALINQVAELVRETIEPEAWREAGGSVASMRELHGQLIITATPQMHAGIANLLTQVREGRAIQVVVEARFITLDPAALDQALGERFRGTLGRSGVASVWQLADAEVQAVLRAAQQEKDATILTAPRITLFNGQRGYVNVSTQTAYVSGFTIFKNQDGETRYEPTRDVAESGVILDVTAVASADRKQATLTLKPKLSRLVALRVAPYMDSKDLSVQVPEVLVHQLQATLNIPDRGTALIGGFSESTVSVPGAPSVTADGIVVENPTTSVRTTVKVPDGGTLLLSGNTTARPVTSNLYLLVKPTLIVTVPPRPEQFPIGKTKIP